MDMLYQSRVMMGQKPHRIFRFTPYWSLPWSLLAQRRVDQAHLMAPDGACRKSQYRAELREPHDRSDSVVHSSLNQARRPARMHTSIIAFKRMEEKCSILLCSPFREREHRCNQLFTHERTSFLEDLPSRAWSGRAPCKVNNHLSVPEYTTTPFPTLTQ